MALNVRFYKRPVHNAFESDKQGRPIHDMVDFCRIEIPGIVANVVDDPANESQKLEHAVEWARYLNEQATGITQEHVGTLLENWPQLNTAQVIELRHYKFYTVEQVAESSDAQIQAIGMSAGMDPRSLRNKAKAWLENARGNLDAEAAKKRDAELAELKETVRKLSEQLTEKRPYTRKEKADA